MIDAIWKGIKFLGNIIYVIYKSISFLFRIPMLSLIASIFTIPIVLVIKVLINMLPENYNVGFVETIIGAIIFIILNIVFYENDIKTKNDFDPNKSLIYFIPTILIWMIPIFYLGEVASEAGYFLSRGEIPSLYAVAYLFFYGPHLWLATLTKNFVFAVAAGLLINSLIYVIKSFITNKSMYIMAEEDEKDESIFDI